MRAALHLALMAAVAVGTLLVVVAPAEHAHLDLDSGLLVSTREEFEVCVELAESLRGDQSALVERIVSALDTVRDHPDWEDAGLGASGPELTLGCPTRTPPSAEPRTQPAANEPVAEPSPYRLWVYVLDDAAADRLVGRGVPAALVAAEHLADGEHRVAEVSTAVLVRAGYLADPAFGRGELTAAAGLSTQAAQVPLPTAK